MMLILKKLDITVVSTIVSQVLFAHFCTVKPITENRLSISDVIVVQKSSRREGKFTFYGWDYYFPCTFSPKLHSLATTQYESILQPRRNMVG